MSDYTPKHAEDFPTETPNTTIENPDVRRNLGKALYITSVVTGVVTIITLVFPELNSFSVDLDRVIIAANAVISFLSGAFGLGVTLPNIPKKS